MKFGLLVPCYNASEYVLEFLENIKKQEKQFDEIIFYDDASTDETVVLLEKNQCTVIKGKANKGPSFARNKLAEITSCNWFHFHDIDDFLHPEYLKKAATIAENHDVDVILCNVDWIDSQREKLLLSWQYSNDEINKNPIGYTISHPIGGINGLYKKSSFQSVVGFNCNIRLWEDADIHVRLAAVGARFHIIEEVLSYSIRHFNTLSSDQSAAWLTRLTLLKKYHNDFQEHTIRSIIGHEAQKVASNLMLLNMVLQAKESLFLSELCGVPVPDNKSISWKILKMILPSSIRIRLRVIQLKFAFRNTFHYQAV